MKTENAVTVSGTLHLLKGDASGTGKPKKYVFRACFVDPFQGGVLARFAHDGGDGLGSLTFLRKETFTFRSSADQAAILVDA